MVALIIDLIIIMVLKKYLQKKKLVVLCKQQVNKKGIVDLYFVLAVQNII